MRRSFFLLCIALVVLGVGALQAQESQKPAISVTSAGKVTAKADLAIVFMTVRSTSPLAADALEQNNKKVQVLKDRLTALGYKEDKVKFSGNRFAPAGGPGIFYGGGQRPTGFDVTNSVFIYLEGPELNDLQQFNTRVSGLLDELSKLGASPLDTPISRISMGGSSVVAFTVKDPSVLEKQAYQQAIENARPIADDIARHMKVQITGVESVTTRPEAQIQEQYASPLEEITYRYLASSLEEVPIRVSLVVRYSYK
jgi:uncharacterized protein YggE